MAPGWPASVAMARSDQCSPSTTSACGCDAGRSSASWAPNGSGKSTLVRLVATLFIPDAGHIINYDLHWNPVRLIQRVGHVDRIGTEHEDIYAYNFFPETGLERELGIEHRLEHRIAEIHRTIGEDAAILHKSEQINEEAMYAIYRDLPGRPQRPGRRARGRHLQLAGSSALGRDYALSELRLVFEAEEDPEEKARLALLSEIFATVPLTARAHRELNNLRRSNIIGQALVAQLLRIVRDYNLEEAHRAIEDRAEEAPLIPRIVCSEALL